VHAVCVSNPCCHLVQQFATHSSVGFLELHHRADPVGPGVNEKSSQIRSGQVPNNAFSCLPRVEGGNA
jgi:hypothetical protein